MIDLMAEAEVLPNPLTKVGYKQEQEQESYKESETDVEGYLPDDQDIPIESDSSDAGEFKDKLGVTSQQIDVKDVQGTLIKLANSFTQSAEAYNELASHLPKIPLQDVVPLVKSLPRPKSKDHSPLANALREHGEEYIMMLLIHRQTKEGCQWTYKKNMVCPETMCSVLGMAIHALEVHNTKRS